MSTYLYLVCPDHDEPIQSEEESGQHHYNLPTIRFNYLRRDHWLQYIDRFPGALGRDFDHLSYFERNTFRFLRDHRDCSAPRIVDEYGGRYDIEAPTVDALLSTKPVWDGGDQPRASPTPSASCCGWMPWDAARGTTSLREFPARAVARWDGNETCSLMRDVAAAVEQIAQARATAAVEAFRARAVEAIEDERLIDDTGRSEDIAYEIGLDHAIRAIRNLT